MDKETPQETTCDILARMDENDKAIQEMEGTLGRPWQEAVLELINVPCADAICLLWREVILTRHGPEYGEWEYPAQAYRHLAAEYRGMEETITVERAKCLRLENELEGLRAVVEAAGNVFEYMRNCLDCWSISGPVLWELMDDLENATRKAMAHTMTGEVNDGPDTSK